MEWIIGAAVILLCVWILRAYNRNKLEERAFEPKDATEARVKEIVAKQMAQGTFSLGKAVDLVNAAKAEVALRDQFPEVMELVMSAEGPDESKRVMQSVRDKYPAFAEAARHQQIVSQSIAIVHSTKNRKTLEARIALLREHQTAMVDTLPFDIDQAQRDKQNAAIDQMHAENSARLAADESEASNTDDIESQLAALMRQSTAFKDAANWDEAVASLYQAKALMLRSEMIHTAESWCKLPLYLQQAGRYDESMAEFQFLLDDLPARAKRDSRLDNPNVGPQSSKQATHDHILSDDAQVIQNKRALAEKRQAQANKKRA